MTTFTLTLGIDTFTGIPGEDNIFLFTPSTLQATDTVTGGATGSFIDTLQLTASGTVTAGQFAGVTNMEQLNLSSGGNNVTLTNGLVAGSSIGSSLFVVVDGAGNDTVDGSLINNGKRLLVISNGGNDTFKGSTGNDVFQFHADQLTSGDSIDGGGAFDTIQFTTAGTVAANALDNVTHVEALALNSGGNSVTIDNTFSAGSETGQIAVIGGAGNDTVEAGGVTNGVSVAFFTNGGGTDTFHGGNGNDFMSVAANDLTAADTLAGGNGGFDFLHIATAGTISAANLAGVSQIEGVIITGTSSITLTNAVVGGSSAGFFAVLDGTGNDTVDASGVTGMNLAFFEVSGNDTFLGGSGDDLYWIAPTHLNGLDTLTGGAGNDILAFSSNGTVSAAQLAGVSQIEVVQLAAGGSVALADTLTSSGALSAVGSGAADTFDASGVSAYGVTFFGLGGADTLIGGAGKDTFRLPDSAFAQVDGNGGLDSIVLTTTGQTFDLTANASKIHDIEVISLSVASGAILTLSAADIQQVNAAGNSLYVLGGTDDEISSTDTWSVIDTDHHNNAVASGVTFIQFHNSATGADLYLSNSFSITIPVEQGGPLPDTAVPEPVAVFANEPADQLAPSITAGVAGHAAVDLDPQSNAVQPFATLAAGISDPDGHSIQALVLALTKDAAIDVGSAFSGHFGSAPGWLDLTNAGLEIAAKAGLHVAGAQTGWMTITGLADESIYTQLLHEVSCASPTGQVPNEYIQAFATDHDGLASNDFVVSLQHPSLDALL